MPTWTDTITANQTQIRGVHIRELVSNLNTERTRRGLSTVSLTIIDLQTKIAATHITSLRSWIDSTPLCSGNYTHKSYDGYNSYNSSRQSYCGGNYRTIC